MNPTLSDLIGGIQSVTLSDEEARRRGTQKSILERKAPPTFGVMVEIQERDRVAVVLDVAAAVDAILRGQAVRSEIRQRGADGEVVVTDARSAPAERTERVERAERPQREERHQLQALMRDELPPSQPMSHPLDNVPVAPDPRNPLTRGRGTEHRPVRIFPFGVSRNRLEQAIAALSLPSVIVRDAREADMVLTLKNYYRQRPQPLRDAEARGVAIYVLRANTVVQMVNVLRDLVREARPDQASDVPHYDPNAGMDPVSSAMFEAEEAINQVMDRGAAIELRPQAPYIRRLQHQLAERYNLGSRSRGREPHRHVEIYPERALD
jgi:hypothetical protein